MLAQTDLLQVRWKLFVMGKLLRNTKILVSRCGGWGIVSSTGGSPPIENFNYHRHQQTL